jgi:adenylate kinase
MEQHTLIFIGMSGCGKGTQVGLLRDHIASKDPGRPLFYLQTGQHFREFIKQENCAARIAKEEVDRGERAPDFLAMYLWSDVFVKNLTGKEHLIIDGSPRSVNEAQNLDIALKFFRRERPAVVHLHVSPEWALQHLLERAEKEGRKDDSREGILKRLSWYERDVMPAVNLYRRDRDYDFIEVNGEQSIDSVHREIIANLFGE